MLGISVAGGLTGYATAASHPGFRTEVGNNSGEATSTVTEAATHAKIEESSTFPLEGSAKGSNASPREATLVKGGTKKWYMSPKVVAPMVALFAALFFITQPNMKDTWRDLFKQWLKGRPIEEKGESELSSAESETVEEELPEALPEELPSERELYLARTSYLLNPDDPERLVVYSLEEAAASTLAGTLEVMEWLEKVLWETKYEERVEVEHPAASEKLAELVFRARLEVNRRGVDFIKGLQQAALLMTEVPQLRKFKRHSAEVEAQRNIQEAAKVLRDLEKKRQGLQALWDKFRVGVSDVNEMIRVIGSESDDLMVLSLKMQPKVPTGLRSEVLKDGSYYVIEEVELLNDMQKVSSARPRSLSMIHMQQPLESVVAQQKAYVNFLQSLRAGTLPGSFDTQRILDGKQGVIDCGQRLNKELQLLFRDAYDTRAAMSVLDLVIGKGGSRGKPMERLLYTVDVALKKVEKAFLKMGVSVRFLP